jgi:hypothetical protein
MALFPALEGPFFIARHEAGQNETVGRISGVGFFRALPFPTQRAGPGFRGTDTDDAVT